MDDDEGIVEMAERAKRIAADTGRSEEDILADLMDDGMLNMSHLKKESGLLAGLDVAEEAAKKLKSLLTTLIPVMLMVAAAGAEMFGVIDFTDAGLYDDDEHDGPGPVVPVIYWGCMDYDALNFDPDANEDDGSCEYEEEPIEGCTDNEAENYDPEAEQDDGSCTYEEPDGNAGSGGEANGNNTENQCTPEFTFYSIQLNWSNNTTLNIQWDADSSCSGQWEIEVDLHIHRGNESVLYSTIEHAINGSDGQWKSVNALNLNSSLVYNVDLALWHDHGSEGGGWKEHDSASRVSS